MNRTEWQDFRQLLREELRGLLDLPLPEDARPEAWTPREVFHHVLLAEAGTVRLLERLSEAGVAPGPEAAWPFRNELLAFSLEKAMGVGPLNNTDPNPEIGDKELDDLEEALQLRLQALAERGDAVDLSEAGYPHPLAGQLNFYEWLVFTSVHEALHLQRLRLDLQTVRN